MQKSLFIKLAIIGVLCLFFVVALMMINGLVNERKHYEQSVIDEIAQTQIGTQTLTTPFVLAHQGNKTTTIVPSVSEITGNLAIKHGEYARGIYKATSYRGAIAIKQSYTSISLPSKPATAQTASPAMPNSATPTPNTQTPTQTNQAPTQAPPTPTTFSLIVPVSDLRGVNLPTVNVGGKDYPSTFGVSSEFMGVGSFLKVDLGQTIPSDVSLSLDLSGLTGLSVVPLGQNSTVTLTGDWQEPKFYGNALPTQKTLNETGFNATWQTAFLAQKNSGVLSHAGHLSACDNCTLSDFQSISTDFVNMDNTYTKTDRTIKYALILLLVSFGTFFLFEIIKGLKIHPIQYLLVASGLLIFYVLLLSLAELIVFWQAYLMASVACVSLITWYASFMLQSLPRSLVFGTILSGLYAGFYVILSASEMNLLLGSVFCFVLLFVVMFITRKIDWYAIGNKADDNDDDHYHDDETENNQTLIHQGA